MKAKKLPSGSWRVRVSSGVVYVNGHPRYKYESFTAPTKKEAEFMAAEWSMNRAIRPSVITVADAVQRYISVKEPYLSPATIRGYERYRTHYYDTIAGVSVRRLDAETVQVWINSLATEKAPKTVCNAFGLLSAAVEMFGGKIGKVDLPKMEAPKTYTPDDEEVKRLLDHAQGELKTAIMLAAFGSLRRGEICALDASDISGTQIRITKDMVMTKDREWVIKPPKTAASVRTVTVPQWVVDQLPTEGRICPITPHQLTDRFRRAVQATKLQHFRLHDMRHYYVSIAHALGVPDAYIMETGGWKNAAVMNRVYKNTLKDHRLAADEKLAAHFEKFA